MSVSYQELQQIDENNPTDQDFQFFTEGAENPVNENKYKYSQHQFSSGKHTYLEEDEQSFKISPSNMNSHRENNFLQFGQKQQQILQSNSKEVKQNLEFQLQQANERLDNMLRLNDYLKKENATIHMQKKRIEDQLNQQTIKFTTMQRKYSYLEKNNKELLQKVNQLEGEKKQILQKWQKASTMLKDEQCLKTIAKNIENCLIQVMNEFNQLNAYLSTYPKQLLNLKQNLTCIQEKMNIIVNFQDEYLNLQQKSTNLTIRSFAKEKTMTNQENLEETQDLKQIISDLTGELSELRYILYVNKKDIEGKNSYIEQLQNKLNSTTMQFTQLYNTMDKSQQMRRMPSLDQEKILREIVQQPNKNSSHKIDNLSQFQKDPKRNLLTNQKENIRRSSLSNSGNTENTPIKTVKRQLSSSQKKFQNYNQQLQQHQMSRKKLISSLNTSYN